MPGLPAVHVAKIGQINPRPFFGYLGQVSNFNLPRQSLCTHALKKLVGWLEVWTFCPPLLRQPPRASSGKDSLAETLEDRRDLRQTLPSRVNPRQHSTSTFVTICFCSARGSSG